MDHRLPALANQVMLFLIESKNNYQLVEDANIYKTMSREKQQINKTQQIPEIGQALSNNWLP